MKSIGTLELCSHQKENTRLPQVTHRLHFTCLLRPQMTTKWQSAQVFFCLFGLGAVKKRLGAAPKSYNGRQNLAGYSGSILAKMLVTFVDKQTCV